MQAIFQNLFTNENIMMAVVIGLGIPLVYLFSAHLYGRRGDPEGREIMIGNAKLWLLGLLLQIIPIIGTFIGLSLWIYTLYIMMRTAITEKDRKLARMSPPRK